MIHLATNHRLFNKPPRPRWHRYVMWSLMAATAISLVLAIQLYAILFGDNIKVATPDESHLFIRQGATMEWVTTHLVKRGQLNHPRQFLWLARIKAGDRPLASGHYQLANGMSSLQLINKLLHRQQTPVKITFNNLRTTGDLSKRLAQQLETDSASLSSAFASQLLLNKSGFTHQTVAALFIPNTYEVYWTVTPDDLFVRFQKEYQRFWDSARTEQSRRAGLTPVEVSVLASIVEQETTKNSEKPTIAGVYINRLKTGMPLQADPTVKFALGDFGLKRIRHEHLLVDSPYNTYKYAGLPPGPICLPSIASIEAVLNYEDHGYYYFCAKDDLSGYHVFARSYNDHMANARKYQKALNRRGVK